MANRSRISLPRCPALFLLAALLAGCSGGGGSAGTGGGTPGTAAVYQVYGTSGDPLAGNPLSNRAWSPWHTLTAALDDPRTGTATRAAMTYDSENFYVAFISDEVKANDSVELWLDPSASQDGKDLFCVSVTPDGKTEAAWYHHQTAPQPMADGSPDMNHAVTRTALANVKGLVAQSVQKAGWTVVIKVPLRSLPAPLAAEGKEGARWHVNLLRYDVEPQGDGNPIVIQSNLSPIYQAKQALSPYRMAEVVLATPASGTP